MEVTSNQSFSLAASPTKLERALSMIIAKDLTGARMDFRLDSLAQLGVFDFRVFAG